MLSFRLSRVRARLTYANVTSTLALVIAFGSGTAFAAATIGSSQIIDNSVRGRDVRDGTLTGADIASGSVRSIDVAGLTGADIAGLTGADITDGTLTGADLLDNSLDGSVYGFNSIGSDHIANGNIIADDIASGAVGADEISTGAVGADEIGTGEVGSDEIGTDAVTSDEIDDGTIAYADLSSAAVTSLLPAAKISNGAQILPTNLPDRYEIASVIVGEGNYIATFTGDASHTSLDTHGGSCLVKHPQGQSGDGGGYILEGNADSRLTNLAITTAFNALAGGEVSVECYTSNGAGAVGVGGTLIVTRIGSLTN